MTFIRDRLPRAEDLRLLNNDSPIVQLRLKVRWQDLSGFIDLYHTYFLPVDRATRQVTWFLHEYRSHFNITFLYRYASWQALQNFTTIYTEAWAKIHGSETLESALRDIEAKENRMNSMVEDDERLVFIEFNDGNWRDQASTAM